jgi:hypothetical protein
LVWVAAGNCCSPTHSRGIGVAIIALLFAPLRHGGTRNEIRIDRLIRPRHTAVAEEDGGAYRETRRPARRDGAVEP